MSLIAVDGLKKDYVMGDNRVQALAGVDRLFILGRGPGLAIAQEAALKLKETCGIQAEAFSGAEVKHGPMAIIEEGFPLKDLRRIVRSVREMEIETGVSVITGDTKVVERGKADGVFITTTGVGVIRRPEIDFSLRKVRVGDAILETFSLR